MKPKDYLRALKKLGLTPSSQATAAALGVSVRQIQNYASGKSPVEGTVELLLQMYLRHGLPQDAAP